MNVCAVKTCNLFSWDEMNGWMNRKERLPQGKKHPKSVRGSTTSEKARRRDEEEGGEEETWAPA